MRTKYPVFKKINYLPAALLIRLVVFVVIVAVSASQVGLFASSSSFVDAGESYPRTGRVYVASSVYVRELPSTKSKAIDVLLNNHPVTVTGMQKGEFVQTYNSDEWFSISYNTSSGAEKSGYILSSFIVLDPLEPVINDPEFEKYLDEQGFPSSYRPMLRSLQIDYPEWVFRALHVDMTWEDAVNGQARSGVSLIENWVDDNWKTTDPVGYDWLNDKWRIYDSDRWIMANKKVIAYYMDPRNMLTPTLIFQFENLSYCDVHTSAGVANILNGTFMSSDKTYQYDAENETQTISYVDTFMKAAELSKVSPYHLTSRVVQEVGASGSASVSGTYPNYEGLYNFFNIGASSSTDPVARGLEYAKYGPLRRPVDDNFTQAQKDYLELIRIPWDNRYDSIIGGAMFLGNNYINNNQNSLYLQRFNLLAESYPSHQYMTNIRAVSSEAGRLARGYVNQDAMNNSIEFLIPVYKEMPEEAALMPSASGNPNNWLKTLQINGKSLTPAFNPEVTSGYSIVVEPEFSEVDISATPVNGKASINAAAAGVFNGKMPLKFGENEVVFTVTAENGSKRTYTVNVIRLKPEEGELHSDSYRMDDTYAYGFTAKDNMNQVKNIIASMYKPEHYTIRIVDKDENILSDEQTVATGHRIELVIGNEVFDARTIILYGDTIGKGRVGITDLNNVVDHILGRAEIKQPYSVAADVDKNGRIGIADLNLILDHVIRIKDIVQK